MNLRAICLSITILLFAVTVPVFAAVIEISTEDLKAKMDDGNLLVINPLSSIEFDNLQITGSINIPIPELKTKLPADKDLPLAFYCLGRK